MRKGWTLVLVALACGLAAAGCGGDIGQQVMANPETQGKVMTLIAQDRQAAEGMLDRLVSQDSTRTLLIEKLVASPAGAQAVMEAVARDQTLLDGTLNVAMRDPAMKEHVRTLFKGVEMASAR